MEREHGHRMNTARKPDWVLRILFIATILCWLAAVATRVMIWIDKHNTPIYPDPVCERCGEPMGEDYKPCRIWDGDKDCWVFPDKRGEAR